MIEVKEVACKYSKQTKYLLIQKKLRSINIAKSKPNSKILSMINHIISYKSITNKSLAMNGIIYYY